MLPQASIIEVKLLSNFCIFAAPTTIVYRWQPNSDPFPSSPTAINTDLTFVLMITDIDGIIPCTSRKQGINVTEHEDRD